MIVVLSLIDWWSLITLDFMDLWELTLIDTSIYIIHFSIDNTEKWSYRLYSLTSMRLRERFLWLLVCSFTNQIFVQQFYNHMKISLLSSTHQQTWIYFFFCCFHTVLGVFCFVKYFPNIDLLRPNDVKFWIMANRMRAKIVWYQQRNDDND